MCLGENDQWYLIGQKYGFFGHCGYSISYFTRTSYEFEYITEIIDRLEGIVFVWSFFQFSTLSLAILRSIGISK